MKRILVGVDGSPRQLAVLDTAATIARATGARIVVFRAVKLPAEIPLDAFRLAPSEFAERLANDARTDAERAAKELSAEQLERVVVQVGAPWQAICRAAFDLDVDLIVVGAHGYDAIDRVLGTTAAKVVNHADRAVLVVRAAERITRP